MTLLEKQWLFSRLLVRLLDFAHAHGYEISLGEAWRSPETAVLYAKQNKGIPNSLHISKLAVDLALFKEGIYQTRSEDYGVMGKFWKDLHPMCRWGGDFSKPDGNHFSFTHEGRS